MDGVKKVIFGVRYVKRRREVPLHWMQSLVLLDTLAWLSSGRVVSPNQALFRYLINSLSPKEISVRTFF